MSAPLAATSVETRTPSHSSALSSLGRRYQFIDALRGIACIGVALFHANEAGHVATLVAAVPAFVRAVFEHGGLGLQIFFVLSGFVIAHSMARANVSVRYIGRFMLRRSIRLDIPYWASILIIIGLGLFAAQILPDEPYDVPSWWNLIAHVLYIQVLVGEPSISPIYWTLCLEVQFYLVFSLLMWGATRLRRRISERSAFYCVMVPALLVSLPFAFDRAPFHVNGLFTVCWHYFVAGVLVWNTIEHPRERLAMALAAAYIGLLGVASILTRDLYMVAAVIASVVIIWVGLRNMLYDWLAQRPLQVLGAMSYSIYLLHNSVTGAVFRAGFLFTERNPWTEAFWLIVVAVACFIAAWVFYHLVERPSHLWSISLRARKKAPPPPLVVPLARGA